MPSARQRKEIGSERYANGSPLKVRNDALALAKAFSPIGFDDEAAAPFVATGYSVRLLDYCNNGPESSVQACAGREPFFLIEDGFNQGEYLPVQIYDTRVGAIEQNSKLCWVMLSKGEVLLDPNTLVFWK